MTAALAISIAATNALAYFTLPTNCPASVPDEYIFAGNPTGKVLRLTPEACSAAYASLSGWIDRKAYLSGEPADQDFVEFGQFDPATGEWVNHPLPWWWKNGKYERLPGVSDLEEFDLPSNRTVHVRLEFGRHLDTMISHMRMDIGGGWLARCYSSLLPRDVKTDTQWTTNVLESLGASDWTNLTCKSWPCYGIMSNDWFVTHPDGYGDIYSGNSTLKYILSLLGEDVNNIGRSTNRFVDVFMAFGLSEDRASSLTNNAIRRLDFDKMSAANIAFASTDVVYGIGSSQKSTYLDEWGYLDEGVGYIWEMLDLTKVVDTTEKAEVTYTFSQNKLDVQDVSPYRNETRTITNYFLIGNVEFERSIEYDNTVARMGANGILSAQINLEEINLRRAIGTLVDGKNYNVVFTVPDPFRGEVDVDIWDADLGIQSGRYRTEPGNFVGVLDVTKEFSYGMITASPAGLTEPYSFWDWKWKWDRKFVDFIECSFLPYLRVTERRGEEVSWTCWSRLCNSVPNSRDPFAEISPLYEPTQIELYLKSESLMSEKLNSIPFMSVDSDRDILRGMLGDTNTVKFSVGPVAHSFIKVKDGMLYRVDGTNEYTFSNIPIGSMNLTFDGSETLTTNYLYRQKGDAPAIVTERWTFPNMTILDN